MHSLRQTVVALALAPWLALSPTAPAEHVHEADDHHSNAVAHRHFESHEHDAAEIDHDEGRVIWLDEIAIQQSTSHISAPPPALAARVHVLADTRRSFVAINNDFAPAHGPPRSAPSLRAPPSPSGLA